MSTVLINSTLCRFVVVQFGLWYGYEVYIRYLL
jgi:hypothetical protein